MKRTISIISGAIVAAIAAPAMSQSGPTKSAADTLAEALAGISPELVFTVPIVGLVSLAFLAVGLAVGVLSASDQNDAARAFPDDFETSMSSDRRRRNRRLAAMVLIAFGLGVGGYAAVSYSSAEFDVHKSVWEAQNAAEANDNAGVRASLAEACVVVGCGDDEIVFVTSVELAELKETVTRAHAAVLRVEAVEESRRGEHQKALATLDESYALNPHDDTLAESRGVHRKLGAHYREEGRWELAADHYKQGKAVDEAIAVLAANGKHELLCDLYPQERKWALAAEACMKAGREERAAYCYAEAGETVRAARMYREMGLHRLAINWLLKAGLRAEVASAYSDWAKAEPDLGVERHLTAAEIYEDLESFELANEQLGLAARAYAARAEDSGSIKDRVAAFHLHTDVEEHDLAEAQLELAMGKAREFRSVESVIDIARLGGELDEGIAEVEGWSIAAADEEEPHEAAQYLTILLGYLDELERKNPWTEEERAMVEVALLKLDATLIRLLVALEDFPTVELRGQTLRLQMDGPNGYSIHKGTTVTGTVENPHDYDIESIELRVVLFNPIPDDAGVELEPWQDIARREKISEEEAKEKAAERNARQKSLWDAPVGYSVDIPVGPIPAGSSVSIERELDTRVSYENFDYYLVKMKK